MEVYILSAMVFIIIFLSVMVFNNVFLSLVLLQPLMLIIITAVSSISMRLAFLSLAVLLSVNIVAIWFGGKINSANMCDNTSSDNADGMPLHIVRKSKK